MQFDYNNFLGIGVAPTLRNQQNLLADLPQDFCEYFLMFQPWRKIGEYTVNTF